MVIGVLLLEVHFPHATSLKDKRSVLAGFKERVKRRFNIALAEVGHHDKWQRSSLAFVTINSQRDVVDQTLEKILTEAETRLEGEIIHSEILHL